VNGTASAILLTVAVVLVAKGLYGLWLTDREEREDDWLD
jgi:hypothetical protein